MNRQKKIVINIMILIILLFVFLRGTGLYLSPLSANRAYEKSIHYGPSKVVHIEDFNGGKYILAKYDKWISCNTFNRKLLFLWSKDHQTTPIEKHDDDTILFMGGTSGDDYCYYGIINDENINKFEIVLENGEVITQTVFYDDMFLIAGTGGRGRRIFNFVNIIGYDLEDNVVYKRYRDR